MSELINDARFKTVLDVGFVRLVDWMGGDLSIVRAARVSYDADWRTGASTGSDTNLLRYLMKNRHSTPFEAVTFTFEVKAPIFVFRQWHRHRTWSYNEVSARYTELNEGFYVPTPETIGVQAAGNKQARDLSGRIEDAAKITEWMSRHNMLAFEIYDNLLASGVPRELARSVLPLSTYSRMFGTVNLWNLMRFLELRLHEHAQWEIRQYAKAILSLAQRAAPRTFEIFVEDLAAKTASGSGKYDL